MTQLKIAYIMSRFPGLSETFILREMCALEEQGWSIGLFPLILQKDRVVHGEAKPWIPRAHAPTFFAIAVANFRLLINRPSLYVSVFAQVVFGNILNPKFLIRAPYLYVKAVEMASRMQFEDVSHIHAHYATHPALVAWIINQLTGISYSITVHAHDIFVHKTMLAEKLRKSTGVVAISEFNHQYLMKILGAWVGEKTHVIHCGIDPGFYSKDLAQPVSPQGGFEILSIGSLRPYKGFTYLLDACAILNQAGFVFRCRIIGGGELKNSLSAQIEKLGLQGTVELLGPKTQSEVAELLAKSNCYIQPSIITPTGKMEGIPVSLMEAMASELPVVATNISGVPELVRHKLTGLLVDPGNPRALADAVMEIYDHPVDAAIRARAGRELVDREFNLSKNVGTLSSLLKTFLINSNFNVV